MPTLSLHPSQHSSSRSGAAILCAVVHATAGTNSLDWLTSNPNGVSAHALITKAGHIYRMVPDGTAAHHVGNSQIRLQQRTFGKTTSPNANQISLGLEIENLNNGSDPYPAVQIASAGWLLADWLCRYPDIDFVKHRDIDTTQKTDPAGLLWHRIVAAAAPWLIPPVAGLYRITSDTQVWEAPDVYSPVAWGGNAFLPAGVYEQLSPLNDGPSTWLHWAPGGFVPRIAAIPTNAAPPAGPRVYSENDLIIARPGLTRDQLIASMVARCQPSPYSDAQVASVAGAFYDLGLVGGVDPVLAAAQCCHETGNLTDPNSLPPEHNTAGIGNPTGGAGVIFPSLEAGARAQVGRLIAYATPPAVRTASQQALVAIAMEAKELPPECHGSAPALYQLGADPNAVPGCGWASPGENYGQAIADTANALVRLA